jgi:hypothetical protein
MMLSTPGGVMLPALRMAPLTVMLPSIIVQAYTLPVALAPRRRIIAGRKTDDLVRNSGDDEHPPRVPAPRLFLVALVGCIVVALHP